MLSRDKILKIDIVTPENAKILSATGKQISLQAYDDSHFKDSEDVMLITKGRGLPEIEHNASVFVIASMRNGQRIRFPAYVSMSGSMQLNIVVRTGMGTVLEERRRYYKVEVNIPCVVNNIIRGGGNTMLSSPYLAKIKDINIGGIFLSTSSMNSLEMNDVLMMTIDLGDKSLEIEAEIIRTQKNAAGDLEGYGCRFINVSPAYEDIISRFVIDLQRQRIQKEQEEK